MKPTPGMAAKPQSSDKVVILSCGLNPPTNEHMAMVSALASRKIGDVWLAPEAEEDEATGCHVKAMCTIFCAEAKASGRADVTCCTAGIDKGMKAKDILSWCRRTFPNKSFELATPMIDSWLKGTPVDYVLERKRAGGPNKSVLGQIVKFDYVQLGGISKSIAAGRDESRNFFPAVWTYIQKHGLYR
jgi:nicotinic acid mononucleotide adenylyltransferase